MLFFEQSEWQLKTAGLVYTTTENERKLRLANRNKYLVDIYFKICIVAKMPPTVRLSSIKSGAEPYGDHIDLVYQVDDGWLKSSQEIAVKEKGEEAAWNHSLRTYEIHMLSWHIRRLYLLLFTI